MGRESAALMSGEGIVTQTDALSNETEYVIDESCFGL